MKCMNKECDNELTGRQRTYCSDRCRKAQTRTETRTNESQVQTRTITDACGNEHPIDSEGRRNNYDLLESWADGQGTEQRRRYGGLARCYRDKDFDLDRYLKG